MFIIPEQTVLPGACGKHNVHTKENNSFGGSEANGKGTSAKEKQPTSTSWQDQNGWLVVFFFVSLIENSLDAIYWHCVDLILRYSWAPLFCIFCLYAFICSRVSARASVKNGKFNFVALYIEAMCETRQRCRFCSAHFLFVLWLLQIHANRCEKLPTFNDLRLVR